MCSILALILHTRTEQPKRPAVVCKPFLIKISGTSLKDSSPNRMQVELSVLGHPLDEA